MLTLYPLFHELENVPTIVLFLPVKIKASKEEGAVLQQAYP